MDGEEAHNPPLVVVVMGVAGSGKTTVAARLAERLGCAFQEGDALHPPENVARMSAGTPLTDADRAPWLARIAACIDGWQGRGTGGVVTCSALKRAYRDIVVGSRDGVRLVHLSGDRALIGQRLGARRGHFMPPALLDTQFATLEPPAADPHTLVLDVAAAPDELVAAIVAWLEKAS
jgi:carbohydrate kinase (thermoresistant glucokinase family)